MYEDIFEIICASLTKQNAVLSAVESQRKQRSVESYDEQVPPAVMIHLFVVFLVHMSRQAAGASGIQVRCKQLNLVI